MEVVDTVKSASRFKNTLVEAMPCRLQRNH